MLLSQLAISSRRRDLPNISAIPSSNLANPHQMSRRMVGIKRYGQCSLGIFKDARIYFVDSLKGLVDLESDLKRQDLVRSDKRNMKRWFDYPELRGKTIRLNNFDFAIVLNPAMAREGELCGVVSHEAFHVVASLCKQIGYNPLNEQEPAAYLLEYLVSQAMGFYQPR